MEIRQDKTNKGDEEGTGNIKEIKGESFFVDKRQKSIIEKGTGKSV